MKVGDRLDLNQLKRELISANRHDLYDSITIEIYRLKSELANKTSTINRLDYDLNKIKKHLETIADNKAIVKIQNIVGCDCYKYG